MDSGPPTRVIDSGIRRTAVHSGSAAKRNATAGGSILGSLLLAGSGHKHASLFVGQWAPTFLILGLYNKIV